MSCGVAHNAHDLDQSHWLEIAEARMAHLERRIALTGKLVWGLCGGAVLGAIVGVRFGGADMGFALGGLLGALAGRLWHEAKVRTSSRPRGPSLSPR